MKIPDTMEEFMGEQPKGQVSRQEAIQKSQKLLDSMRFSIAVMSSIVVRSQQIGICDTDPRAKQVNKQCADSIDTLSRYCTVIEDSIKDLKKGEKYPGVID